IFLARLTILYNSLAFREVGSPSGPLGGAGDGFADIADQSVDQRLVVRLAHHPDDRFGARRADQEPATFAQASGRVRDRLRHRRIFARPAALDTNVAQHLWHRLEPPTDFARRLARLSPHPPHLPP